MKTAQAVDELSITDAKQAERARHQLEEIRVRRAEIADERETVLSGVGRALALVGLGNKTAKTRVGELSLKRSGLEAEDRDLAATERALDAALQAWEHVEAERARTAIVARFDQLTAQRQEAEHRFAGVIVDAINAVAALNANAAAYQQAVEDAARIQAPIPQGARPPHQPAVVNLSTIYRGMWENPQAIADRWLKNGWR